MNNFEPIHANHKIRKMKDRHQNNPKRKRLTKTQKRNKLRRGTWK